MKLPFAGQPGAPSRGRALILPLAAAFLTAAISAVLLQPRNRPPVPISASRIAVLAETAGGVESLSFQFIANPVLNAAMDAYGRAEERYDVSRWHEVFMAFLDGSAGSLIADALFFDLDEPERKHLVLGEGLWNPDAVAIREAVLAEAEAAEGRLVWFSTPSGAGPRRRLAAARLVKRLSDGSPIGLLVLIVEERRLASGLSAGDAEGPLSLLRSDGILLAGEPEEAVGASLESAYPGAGRLLAQLALGIVDGSAELKIRGRRTSFAFSRVPRSDWVVLAPAEAGGSALAWVWRSLALAAFALALYRLIAEISRSGPGAQLGGLPSLPSASLPSYAIPSFSEGALASESAESLLPPEDSESPPAWFRELAPRERSIVILLAAGKSNKEIAAELGLAEQTVKNRLGLIYERLGVHDRVSAALVASRSRLPRVNSGS